MKSIEEAIYTRLTEDDALETLLTGPDRIYHAMEARQAKKPSLTYMLLSAVAGSLNSDTVQTMEETYQFMIFSDEYVDVAYRLRQLLDGVSLPDNDETGNIRCVWEADDGDLWDEALEVGRKDVRYRVMLTPKAVGAV